jgi:hypothetical protein
MENTDLLRPMIVQGLLKSELSKESQEFKAWLSSGNYLVRSVPSSKEIHIEINNDYSFNHMLAFDSCRMATAAFETMENIQLTPILPKSYGWIAIKCYYAAFFSAHAIMRCFGYTCSQLERGHIKLLNDYCLALGVSNTMRVEGGFYSGQYNSSNRMFALKKMANTHEDTWLCFVKCLNSLSLDVLSVSGVTSKKQALSAELTDLISTLKNEGRLTKGNYLSQFRNSINYRQKHCAWHPYGKKSIKTDKIMALIKNWKNETIPLLGSWKESRDAYNFFYSCTEIVNLCYKVINIIIDNSATINNLYSRWPNKFLKLTAVT